MTTDTDLDLLEAQLRALYQTVAPPDVPRLAAPSGASTAGGRLGAGRAGSRRQILGRGLALGVVAAVVFAGVELARRPAVTPAPPARLVVSVLPPGGQLDCTLAVSALSDATATGFITFSHGHAAFHPVATQGNTYVPGLHRWVETTPQMVAPGGASYVTASGDLTHSRIQVVDATGTHTVLSLQRGFISPLGFSPLGIVLIDTSAAGAEPAHPMPISLLDPRTGRVRSLPPPVAPPILGTTGAGNFGGSTGYQAGTDSVWMQSYNSASNLSVVSRYDLTSGATTVWFDGRIDGAGAAQPVAETSSGRAIIQVASSDIAHIAPGSRAGIIERTLVMARPHQAVVVNAGRVGDPGVADNLSPLSAIDGQDVWLAGDNGTLWRYQPGRGLQAMALIRTSSNGAPGVSISGPCV